MVLSSPRAAVRHLGGSEEGYKGSYDWLRSTVHLQVGLHSLDPSTASTCIPLNVKKS